VYTLAEKYHSAVFTYETSIYYTQEVCDYKADELDKAIKAMKEQTDVSIPSTVVNLVAEDTNYKTITLTWDAAENATDYEVYRKAWDSEEFKLYKTVEDTTVAVTGVMTGKEYAFYVVAKNEA
jgi:fibronectin type 3 domain-containing protein